MGHRWVSVRCLKSGFDYVRFGGKEFQVFVLMMRLVEWYLNHGGGMAEW